MVGDGQLRRAYSFAEERDSGECKERAFERWMMRIMQMKTKRKRCILQYRE